MSSWQCALFCLLLLVCVSHTSNRKKKEKSYYEILEVQANATQREIRKAYFALIKIYHPDKNELYDEKKKVREQFERISNAYEILSDEEKRTQYDRLLELGHTEYKEGLVPKQTEESDDIYFQFKDPYKAYEDALKKEEEEAWKEKVFNVALVTFISGIVFFTGWIIFILLKRTRYYQKIEKQKQEQEIRKNIAGVKKKRTEKTEKEKKQQQQQAIRQQEVRQRRLENRAQVDLNKVTKWAGDDEDTVESDPSSSSSDEEISSDNDRGTAAGLRPRQMFQSKTDIYCMACHKYFKSINQWDNHELSKKHRTGLVKLTVEEKEVYFKVVKEYKIFSKNLEKQKQEEKRKKIEQEQQEAIDLENPEKIGSEPEVLETTGDNPHDS